MYIHYISNIYKLKKPRKEKWHRDASNALHNWKGKEKVPDKSNEVVNKEHQTATDSKWTLVWHNLILSTYQSFPYGYPKSAPPNTTQ